MPPPEAKMSSAEEKMLSNMDRLAVSGEFGRLGKSALNATIGIPKAFRGLQNARHGMPGTGGSHGMELGCRGGNGWCDGDMGGGSPNLISSTPFASIAKECRIGCKEINSA